MARLRPPAWLALVAVGCGEANYETCDVPGDCTRVPDFADPACIDKPGSGFCTWPCETDDDCADVYDDRACAVLGSAGGDRFCFPTCDPDEEDCPYGMACRSTDDGEVCLPEDSCR